MFWEEEHELRCGCFLNKALLINYVDAGNNLANANDIYSGLHYASSIANAKVAVIDIDK